MGHRTIRMGVMVRHLLQVKTMDLVRARHHLLKMTGGNRKMTGKTHLVTAEKAGI